MINVKGFIVTGFLILCFCWNIQAQTYSLVPGDSVEMTGGMEDMQTLTISQLNNAPDSITLAWQKISESIPASWEASLCDNKFCNPDLPDSGSMNKVASGETGFLLLHITPHVNSGAAIVRYTVWDVTNPALKDTLTWILTASAISSTDPVKFDTSLKIFPNPASESVVILCSGQYEYTIQSSSGNLIQSGFSDSDNNIDLRHLPSGYYFISIKNALNERSNIFPLIVIH